MERRDDGVMVISKDIFVTKEGKIAYRIFLVGLFRGSGLKNGLVPDKVLKQGVSAVAVYVERIMEKMIRDSYKARQAYIKIFENNNVDLRVKLDGRVLKGTLRPSKKEGLVTFDVELVSPKKYRSIDTMYANKYPCPPRKLVEEDGRASQLAIDEAKELLIKMYNNKKHREKHSLAYKIVKKVNLTSKEK